MNALERTTTLILEQTLLNGKVAPIAISSHFLTPSIVSEAFLNILKDIHAAGVMHRDVRSDNLLIDSENEVYILDFDSATLEGLDGSNYQPEINCLEAVVAGTYDYTHLLY